VVLLPARPTHSTSLGSGLSEWPQLTQAHAIQPWIASCAHQLSVWPRGCALHPEALPTAVCSCAMLHQGPRSSLACGPPQRPVSVQPASLLTEPTPLLEMPSPFESSEGHGDGPAGRRKNNIIVVSGTSRLARAHEARITAGWTSAADGRVRAQGNRVQHGGRRVRGKRASRGTCSCVPD
jgi:hypothetical protein